METPVPPSDPTILYRRPNAQTSTTPETLTTPETPSSPETLIAPEAPTSPTMPAILEISDFWPDAPYRRTSQTRGNTRRPQHPRSHAGEPDGTLPITVAPARPAPPAEPARRRRLGLPLRLALAVLLLAGIALLGTRVPYFSARSSNIPAASATTQPPADRRPAASADPAAPPAAQPSAPASTTISGPVNDRKAATFELVSDATSVNLRAAALGTDLYRISTPNNSAAPQVKATDEGIRLFLVKSRGRTDLTVDIVLNSSIRWSLTMTGGVQKSTLDLAATTIDSVNLVGGATRIDLTLPHPGGTVPVRMSGGVNQFQIYTAGTEAARLRVREGAGKVVFNGQTDNGVDQGVTFVSPDFADSVDRIDVDAVAGVGTLTIGPA